MPKYRVYTKADVLGEYVIEADSPDEAKSKAMDYTMEDCGDLDDDHLQCNGAEVTSCEMCTGNER